MKQHTILCVDDEPNILNSLKRLLRKESYNVITATSGVEALQIMEETPVDLVISDQRMPFMSGAEFLTEVKKRYPDTVRFILTGYSDMDAAIVAINEGEVYRYITKPWNDEELKHTIRLSLEHYDMIQQNKYLLKRIRGQNKELREKNAALEKRNKFILEMNKSLEETKKQLEKKLKEGQYLAYQYEKRIPQNKFRNRII